MTYMWGSLSAVVYQTYNYKEDIISHWHCILVAYEVSNMTMKGKVIRMQGYKILTK